MQRCVKCILPETYPGITFNEEGICNHCVDLKERTYLGEEALKKEIESYLDSRKDRNKTTIASLV